MMAGNDIERLRGLAEAAIPGNPMDRDQDTGRWEPWFNTHGDPYVVEEGRGQWAIVATVCTAPEDYGRARAQFIGALHPRAVLDLCDEVAHLRNALTDAGIAVEPRSLRPN